jgi:hypothetical protein
LDKDEEISSDIHHSESSNDGHDTNGEDDENLGLQSGGSCP